MFSGLDWFLFSRLTLIIQIIWNWFRLIFLFTMDDIIWYWILNWKFQFLVYFFSVICYWRVVKQKWKIQWFRSDNIWVLSTASTNEIRYQFGKCVSCQIKVAAFHVAQSLSYHSELFDFDCINKTALTFALEPCNINILFQVEIKNLPDYYTSKGIPLTNETVIIIYI